MEGRQGNDSSVLLRSPSRKSKQQLWHLGEHKASGEGWMDIQSPLCSQMNTRSAPRHLSISPILAPQPFSPLFFPSGAAAKPQWRQQNSIKAAAEGERGSSTPCTPAPSGWSRSPGAPLHHSSHFHHEGSSPLHHLHLSEPFRLEKTFKIIRANHQPDLRYCSIYQLATTFAD